MEGSQPHETRSIAVSGVTCAALVRSLTACTFQYDVMRAFNLLAVTEVDDTHGQVGGTGKA